jgi:hypothetical protein
MKQSTPKLDALRLMREQNYKRTHPPRKSVAALKESIAAIPAKKRKKEKP